VYWGDVLFFGLKKAVDDIVDHLNAKASFNGDVFVCVDILGPDGIDLEELYPGIKLEKRFAGRDKEQAAFFDTS